MLGTMGIKFVSKDEIEAQQKAFEAARAASEKVAEEARRAEGAKKKERVDTGESTWVAPALERRLNKHKEKKEKKHKHKRRERAEPGRGGSDSDSGDEPAVAAAAAQPGASSSGGDGRGAPVDRDSAGLSFMMKAAGRAGAFGTSSSVRGAAAAAAPSAEEAAAATEAARAKVRLARELNPYASGDKDSSAWTRDGVACFSHASLGGSSASSGAAPTPATRAVGTDGGASWKQKQLLRAVEHARESGEALREVCLERFGTLESFSEMERIHQRLENGKVRNTSTIHTHTSPFHSDWRVARCASRVALSQLLLSAMHKHKPSPHIHQSLESGKCSTPSHHNTHTSSQRLESG